MHGPFWLLLILGLTGWLVGLQPALAQEAGGEDRSGLEKLLNETVTSVAKKEELLLESASAIYVITQEDIRRSGASSIPEVLRMVPGIQVAHIDANKWAITCRGFNGRYANKLLVLIDGRTVYTPIFSGVYWDVQDTLLSDIDRIEVIRGPGAALWGANAVNGVINVITKRAVETLGWTLTGNAGNQEQGVGARYGGKITGHAAYRLYSKYFNQESFLSGADAPPHDQWNMARGGGRIDWTVSDHDSLTIQGDVYKNNNESTVVGPITIDPPVSGSQKLNGFASGGNLTARWSRYLPGGSDLNLQLYYDETHDNDLQNKVSLKTFDLDMQHHFGMGFRHDIVWGLGYRFTKSDSGESIFANLVPPSSTHNLFSFLIQDEIILLADKLRLTVGTKLERNDFTGLEVQPSARVFWKSHPAYSFWAAVSRSVRTPSLVDRNSIVRATVFPGPNGLPTVVGPLGSSSVTSETLIAYEFGYRVQPNRQLFVDIATFYNRYSDLSITEPSTPFIETTPPPAHLFIPFAFENGGHGRTYGAEVAATWSPTGLWRFTAGYSRLNIDIKVGPFSQSTDPKALEGGSPGNQLQFASYLNLGKTWDVDAFLYYAGRLKAFDVPQYTRVDARLGWRPTESLELSFIAQNLLDRGHLEFDTAGSFFDVTRVPRTFYTSVTWKY